MKNTTPEHKQAALDREYREARLTLKRVHRAVIVREPREPKPSASEGSAR
jgi:hypothetical protein